jgi:hypothetical protein
MFKAAFSIYLPLETNSVILQTKYNGNFISEKYINWNKESVQADIKEFPYCLCNLSSENLIFHLIYSLLIWQVYKSIYL